MKISEVTQGMILNQLRESAAALSVEDLAYIDALKEATIAYIKDWTGIGGLDEPDSNGRMLDDYEDIVYPFMAIISFMAMTAVGQYSGFRLSRMEERAAIPASGVPLP